MKRECYSLGGLKGQTENSFSVGGRLPPELLRIVAANGGDLRKSMRDPCRLVPFATVRHGGEVRGIGLDQKTIVRHQPEEVVVRPLVEGDDAAERHIPAGVDRVFCQRVRAGVAVQNADNTSSSCFTYDRARVVLRITSVNDYRTARFSSQGNLCGEGRALGLARRVVVVVVEATLAYRDGAGAKKRAELRYVPLRVKRCRVVGVNACRRENEAHVFGSAFSRDRGGFDGLADADDRGRARIAGAGDYRVAVAGERRVREVGVAVDED